VLEPPNISDWSAEACALLNENQLQEPAPGSAAMCVHAPRGALGMPALRVFSSCAEFWGREDWWGGVEFCLDLEPEAGYMVGRVWLVGLGLCHGGDLLPSPSNLF